MGLAHLLTKSIELYSTKKDKLIEMEATIRGLLNGFTMGGEIDITHVQKLIQLYKKNSEQKNCLFKRHSIKKNGNYGNFSLMLITETRIRWNGLPSSGTQNRSWTKAFMYQQSNESSSAWRTNSRKRLKVKNNSSKNFGRLESPPSSHRKLDCILLQRMYLIF